MKSPYSFFTDEEYAELTDSARNKMDAYFTIVNGKLESVESMLVEIARNLDVKLQE